MTTFPWLIIIEAFIFLVCLVGGYVFMFLNVMRVDPREIEFRKYSNDTNSLIPKKLS